MATCKHLKVDACVGHRGVVFLCRKCHKVPAALRGDDGGFMTAPDMAYLPLWEAMRGPEF